MKKSALLIIFLSLSILIDHDSVSMTLNTSKNDSSESFLLTGGDCSWNGIELYGTVQFVESFPDIKIQIVESFPDINVKLVESFPNDCGEWQVVESFPDFKVQVVESFPDLKVKYVEAFPGME